jgi:nucleoside-diphosphate-sugar epimerase
MSAYLVTGAGMVGGALVARLKEDGHDVRVLDTAPPATFVADLRDRHSLDAAVQGVDGVFHTAALHGFRDAPPRDFFDVNVNGTWNLLEAMAAAGVRRLVHASTVGVYGERQPVVIGPDTPTGAEADVYGVTKMMAESAVRWFAEAHGIKAVALRYGGIVQTIVERYGELPEGWAASGAVVDLADVVEATARAMERLPLPRFAYVVAPSGGTATSPYRIDASATEADLDMAFSTVEVAR